MAWYWIVLIVVCYVLLSIVTCLVLSKVAKDAETGLIVLFGIFWPLVIMSLPLIMFVMLLFEIVDKYSYKEE